MIKIKNIKISVIIPIFNVEKFIGKCLESILNQNLTNIEILCIDDASTDSSLEVVKKYAKQDSRIKIIHNETNRGQGFCRNIGINKAKGNFICFIDSDDWINADTLEKMYYEAETNKLDLVICKLICYDNNEKKLYNTNYYDMKFLDYFSKKIFNHWDIKDSITSFAVMPCNKLYSKKLIIENKIFFPEKYKMFEDNPFFYDVILNSNKIMFIPEYLYNKRMHEKSITYLKDTLLDIFGIYEDIFKIFKKNNVFELYKTILYNNLAYVFKLWFDEISYDDDRLKNSFYNNIKERFNYLVNFENELNEKNKLFFENIKYSKNLNDYHLKDLTTSNELLINENIKLKTNLSKNNNSLKLLSEKNNDLKKEILQLNKEQEIYVSEFKRVNESYLKAVSENAINLRKINEFKKYNEEFEKNKKLFISDFQKFIDENNTYVKDLREENDSIRKCLSVKSGELDVVSSELSEKVALLDELSRENDSIKE